MTNSTRETLKTINRVGLSLACRLEGVLLHVDLRLIPYIALVLGNVPCPWN